MTFAQGKQISFVVEPRWFAKKGGIAYLRLLAKKTRATFEWAAIDRTYYEHDSRHFSAVIQGSAEAIATIQEDLPKFEKRFRVRIV